MNVLLPSVLVVVVYGAFPFIFNELISYERFTGSIPGGLTATLALHKWRSKNAPFKTPLYL